MIVTIKFEHELQEINRKLGSIVKVSTKDIANGFKSLINETKMEIVGKTMFMVPFEGRDENGKFEVNSHKDRVPAFITKFDSNELQFDIALDNANKLIDVAYVVEAGSNKDETDIVIIVEPEIYIKS